MKSQKWFPWAEITFLLQVGIGQAENSDLSDFSDFSDLLDTRSESNLSQSFRLQHRQNSKTRTFQNSDKNFFILANF